MADVALQKLLRSRPSVPDPGRLVADVGEALDLLHRLSLVHCDVAPNNVLRVAGIWKLADLDSCLPIGCPVTRFPSDRYRHPDAKPGARAEPAFDFYGLERIAACMAG